MEKDIKTKNSISRCKVKTYPCGLRMVVTPMPSFKSVSVAVLVGAGSRDEEPNEFGLSHYVEHMLFKGTKTRTSREIANTLSGLGVDYNAWTSSQATCYHTKGLNSNIDVCCDILSDMYFNLSFKEEDFVHEGEVIIQEIAMHDDNPRTSLIELANATFFSGTPYGHNIAGTVESVKAFKSQDIYNYMYKHYTAPKTIICFAGDITLTEAESMTQKYFLSHFNEKAEPRIRQLANAEVTPTQNFVTKQKEIEQNNVAILFPVMNNNHPDKYKMIFVNEILSSDMSSRLFDSVRDKLGLVYTISGGINLTHLGGFYFIFFSCTPKNTELVLKTIAEEIAKIKKDGVTEQEAQKVKNIKLTDKYFESESVEARNIRSGVLLAEFNEIQSTEEYMQLINAVTAAQVKEAAVKYLDYKNAIVAVVGNKIKLKPFEVLQAKAE